MPLPKTPLETIFSLKISKKWKKYAFDLNDAIEVSRLEYGYYAGDKSEDLDARMARVLKED